MNGYREITLSNGGVTSVDGRGLLLVGHGTRDPRGMAAFFQTVDHVRGALPGTPVEPSLLEFARPTIAEAMGQLANRGVRVVTAMPLFLLAAGHVRRDIPPAVADAARQWGFRVNLASHLGPHPRVVDLSVKRYRESVNGRQPVSLDETLLLLVGRGTRDQDALDEMARFAGLRRTAVAMQPWEVCFASVAQPRLDDVLPRVARWPIRRVVVQPHLLYPGSLAERISTTVAKFAERCPALDWVVSQPLGPDPLLAEAIVDVFSQVPCPSGS